MKKISLIVNVFFLLIVFTSSCIKKPTLIKVNSVTVKAVTDSLIYLDFNYDIRNPNQFKYSIKNSSANIYYKDSLIGNASMKDKISLPPQDTVSINMNCRIELIKISPFFADFIQSDQLDLRAKGNSKTGPFSWITVGFDEVFTMNTNEIVQQEIKKYFLRNRMHIYSLKIDKIPGFQQSNFQLSIGLDNDLPIKISIQSLDLDLYLNEHEPPFGKSKLNKTVEVQPNVPINLPLDLELHQMTLVSQFDPKWLFNPKVNVLVKGEALLKIGEYKFTVPVKELRKIDLGTFGFLAN